MSTWIMGESSLRKLIWSGSLPTIPVEGWRKLWKLFSACGTVVRSEFLPTFQVDNWKSKLLRRGEKKKTPKAIEKLAFFWPFERGWNAHWAVKLDDFLVVLAIYVHRIKHFLQHPDPSFRGFDWNSFGSVGWICILLGLRHSYSWVLIQ